MPKRIPQIESIRVLTFIAIFLYHLWSVFPNAVNSFWEQILSQGFAGVIVFNIISGFVLTLPFVGTDAKIISSNFFFWRARFSRICPQYYISIIIWSFVLIFAGSLPLIFVLRSTLEHFLFIHVFNPSSFFSIVPAWWWLGLLAQFYLFFPFLLKALIGLKSPIFLFLTFLLCWGGWGLLAISSQSPGDLPSILNYMFYFNLTYRLPEFALGMTLAKIWKNNAARFQSISLSASISLYAITIILIFARSHLSESPFIPLQHILLIFCCLFLVLSLYATPLIKTLGENKFIIRASVLSYTFYLIHQPVLEYGSDILKLHLSSPLMAFCLLGIAASLISYWLSIGIEHLANLYHKKFM